MVDCGLSVPGLPVSDTLQCHFAVPPSGGAVYPLPFAGIATALANRRQSDGGKLQAETSRDPEHFSPSLGTDLDHENLPGLTARGRETRQSQDRQKHMREPSHDSQNHQADSK